LEKISVLGSTGSVGQQSLEVARELGIGVSALAAGKNIKILAKQILEFSPEFVSVSNEQDAAELSKIFKRTEFGFGENGLILAAQSGETVINAVSGFAGVDASFAAAHAGKKIALANKETIVCGGDIFLNTAHNWKADVLPLDSEHSAIWQCLGGKKDINGIKKLILTASGGPFLEKTKDELENATPEQAKKHPNWNMGEKICVDCATMMNKGLEIVEAAYLFGIDPLNINVIIHRESIIHSMVEFAGGSILAQLSKPDMRLPVLYALGGEKCTNSLVEPLDFVKTGRLTFSEPTPKMESLFNLFRNAAKIGASATCTLNAANEVAVNLFLHNKLKFTEIEPLVRRVFEKTKFKKLTCFEEIKDFDAEVRKTTFADVKKT
jgi:1-deoxy-D-xylulose-5-phosphate reductoisomerase